MRLVSILFLMYALSLPVAAQVIDFENQPTWPTETWPSEIVTHTSNTTIVDTPCSGYVLEISGQGGGAGLFIVGPISGVTSFLFDAVDIQPGNSGKVDVIEYVYNNGWVALSTQRYSVISATCPISTTITHAIQNTNTTHLGIQKATGSNSIIRVDNIRSNGALPVELSTFLAIDKTKEILLKWKTTTELNNYGFVVERIFNLSNTWEVVAFVPGYGSSYSPKYYSYRDTSLRIEGKEIVFYRLKQLDKDGSISYSEIVRVVRSPLPLNSIVTYPSPFQNTLQLALSVVRDLPITIRLYNTSGVVVKELYSGMASENLHMTFNTENVPNGIYFIVVMQENKIILQAKAIKT